MDIKLKKRLFGAIVILAIIIIFVPMLFKKHENSNTQPIMAAPTPPEQPQLTPNQTNTQQTNIQQNTPQLQNSPQSSTMQQTTPNTTNKSQTNSGTRTALNIQSTNSTAQSAMKVQTTKSSVKQQQSNT
jgi:cell division septation protein DedD